MKRQQGLTIIELLIAMVILGIVLSLSFNTIIQGSRGQRLNETQIAIQSKLRRVMDVISQDIRGSVFGTLSTIPYTNTNTSFSVARIVGGAGYSVLRQGTSATVGAGNLQFVGLSTSTPNLGNLTILLNGEGVGAIFNATNITKVPNASTNNLYQLTMPSCGSINYTDNLLLHRISTIGYSYDASNRTLNFRTDRATLDQPLAYDIDAFEINYIYVNQVTGAITEVTTPTVTNGVPQKEYLVNGSQKVVLKQLQIRITASQLVGRRRVTRSYQSTIDLSYTQSLNVKDVRTC